MFLALLASVVTYDFSRVKGIGAIRSSSIVGVFIYLVSLKFEFIDAKVLFGATFVGMCSSDRLNRIEVILATSIYLLALSFLESYFVGFGGLLGMSSFIGVVAIFILSKLHKKFLLRNRGT